MLDRLRSAFVTERSRRPFIIDAIVVLPDHLHTIWTLPPGDADYSTRWQKIKEHVGRGKFRSEAGLTAGRRSRGEALFWQRRYWEHRIRDEQDFARHFDYIHFNPVKHGLVADVCQWPHSSFQRAVRQGIYPPSWGADFTPCVIPFEP